MPFKVTAIEFMDAEGLPVLNRSQVMYDTFDHAYLAAFENKEFTACSNWPYHNGLNLVNGKVHVKDKDYQRSIIDMLIEGSTSFSSPEEYDMCLARYYKDFDAIKPHTLIDNVIRTGNYGDYVGNIRLYDFMPPWRDATWPMKKYGTEEKFIDFDIFGRSQVKYYLATKDHFKFYHTHIDTAKKIIEEKEVTPVWVCVGHDHVDAGVCFISKV